MQTFNHVLCYLKGKALKHLIFAVCLTAIGIVLTTIGGVAFSRPPLGILLVIGIPLGVCGTTLTGMALYNLQQSRQRIPSDKSREARIHI